jgi:hydroxyacylglutathione hydrolase
MKKTIKVILWALVTIFGLFLFGALIFLFNFLRATRSMTPDKSGMINDSVWCIKDHYVNAYVFRGKSGYIMIDAGIGKKTINNELSNFGIKPKMINAIFLTHTDADHIGSIGLFKNAVLYMNQDEVQMIDGKKGKTKFFKPKWNYGPYTSLHDNDTVSIGGLEIRILLTPGHTPGSSCYIIGKDYLASGDNLVVINGKYEHFSSRFNMNTIQQTESIKRLPDPKSFKYILTGHNGIVKNLSSDSEK